MAEKKDLVLATVPYTDTPIPLYAIAQLKSVAMEAGWTCKAMDFNNEFLVPINNHRHGSALVDWFYHETYHPGCEKFILDMIHSMANRILAHKPKMVGLSLFSYASQIATKYLCLAIRRKDPSVTIVIGGSGCFDNVLGESVYVDAMHQMNLINHHFTGDAELAFYDFLKGKHDIIGMDESKWKELSNKDIAEIPFADFDDYDWTKYRTPVIPMTASRGCVRRCKFCSDIAHWKMFSFRTGQHIFDEMLFQAEKYKIKHFAFTDALINGNVREFRNLCGLLSEYNSANPDDKISWESQFIFRPQKQFKEDEWELLAGSNPTELFTGIESLDPEVRHDMGKKFNQEDLNFNLEQCLKHNIHIFGMMIVGYPTEDEHSIQVAKDWLTNNTHFQPVLEFSFGGTMAILPGTYLDNNREEYGIEVFGPPWQMWSSNKSGSTPEKRLEWWRELSGHAKELGYEIGTAHENESVVHLLSSMDHQKSLEEQPAYKNNRALDVQNYKDFHDQLDRLKNEPFNPELLQH